MLRNEYILRIVEMFVFTVSNIVDYTRFQIEQLKSSLTNEGMKILMEHVDMKSSLESGLHFDSICSIGIYMYYGDIFKIEILGLTNARGI